MTSPLVAVAPAWIGATLLWWVKPSSASMTLSRFRPVNKSALPTSGVAKPAAPKSKTPERTQHERYGSGDVRRALLASGMFSKTDPAAFSRWCKQLMPVRYPPGHIVGARGDFGGCLYLIISGKVKVSYCRPDTSEFSLTVLGSSEIFGGIPLFDYAACETSVTALTEVRAVPIERAQLLMWMTECSGFSTQVLRLFARWSKATTNALTDFAFADVQCRVASRLLCLRKRFGCQEGEVVRVVHGLTLEDFSLLVGASAEIIVKTLCDFESRGWIHLDEESLVVLDSQALASVRPDNVSEAGCVRSI